MQSKVKPTLPPGHPRVKVSPGMTCPFARTVSAPCPYAQGHTKGDAPWTDRYKELGHHACFDVYRLGNKVLVVVTTTDVWTRDMVQSMHDHLPSTAEAIVFYSEAGVKPIKSDCIETVDWRVTCAGFDTPDTLAQFKDIVDGRPVWFVSNGRMDTDLVALLSRAPSVRHLCTQHTLLTLSPFSTSLAACVTDFPVARLLALTDTNTPFGKLRAVDLLKLKLATHFLPENTVPNLLHQLVTQSMDDALEQQDRVWCGVSLLECWHAEINAIFGHSNVHDILTALAGVDADWARHMYTFLMNNITRCTQTLDDIH
jgi:hypothetical protein